MIKSKLFIDYDSTITDSITSFLKVYSDRYSWRYGYVEPNPYDTNCWNFSDVAPMLEYGEVEEIFGTQSFFNYVKPFPNAVEVLKKLNEKYEVIIVSIGTFSNISKKSIWIKENLPFIHNFIGIVNNGATMDKSLIRMAGTNDKSNVFLDDSADNLFSQQGTDNLIRYCFGSQVKPWNSDWHKQNGRWLKDWNEVANTLL